MKSKLVIRVAFISSLICLSVSSAYKKETNEKVKTKHVYYKETLNKKFDETEESKAMGEIHNESEAEQKESIIKDRIKRHLFKNPFRDRQQPIIIINRYPEKDPGNAWGQPQTTKGWAAPPPPTKGWTTPPPPTKGWTTAPPPPPPPPTRGWNQPPPPPPPPTQGWNQPPPPPPKQTGWTNLQAQADREVSGGNSWNIDQRIYEAGSRLLPSASFSSSGGAIRF